MNIRDYAEKELNILINKKFTGRAIIKEDDDKKYPLEYFIPEILAICEKFGNSGQSGSSAPYIATILSETIKKICLFEPLSPITGEPDEWLDVSEFNDNEPLYQNKRCSSIFKKENGRAYYIDALIKRCPNGNCYSGRLWLSKSDYLSGNRSLMISSIGYIKSFPFKPKKFYIDVIEEEVAPDDWEMFLKDKNQLEEFYKYYDPK